MGKNSQIRREKKDQLNKERKELRRLREEANTPWLHFWKRFDFWIYAACFVALMAFPIIKKDNLVIGDQAIIHTSMGDIEVDLYAKDAPKTVENFAGLATRGYYNNLIWHRVIKGFMIQGGDPTGTGTGGESIWTEPFEDEINANVLGLSKTSIDALVAKGYAYDNSLSSHKMKVGSLAMANSGPNTNGSQFFIITEKDQPHLDGQHTVFGQVKKGFDVAKKISEVAVDTSDKPTENVYITSVELK
jgi:cyclophilin family peptidyl-prolyl cis-trans isomerase